LQAAAAAAAAASDDDLLILPSTVTSVDQCAKACAWYLFPNQGGKAKLAKDYLLRANGQWGIGLSSTGLAQLPQGGNGQHHQTWIGS